MNVARGNMLACLKELKQGHHTSSKRRRIIQQRLNKNGPGVDIEKFMANFDDGFNAFITNLKAQRALKQPKLIEDAKNEYVPGEAEYPEMENTNVPEKVQEPINDTKKSSKKKTKSTNTTDSSIKESRPTFNGWGSLSTDTN